MRLTALLWVLTISAQSHALGVFQSFESLMNSVLVVRSGSAAAAGLKVTMPPASPEFLDEQTLRVFVASDVSRDDTSENILNVEDAYATWMAAPYYGKNQAKAIYLLIYGTNEEAGREVNSEYCDHVREFGFREVLDCGPDSHLTYVEGGGSIGSNGPLTGYYKLNMSTRGHGASRSMAFHELFHVYQISNIFEAFDQPHLKSKLGKLSGDDVGTDVAWWTEGNADFFSALYSSDAEHFKGAMRDALEGFGPFTQSRKQQYFDEGEKLYNLSWEQGDTVDLAYRIGSWFVAYLVAEHGEKKIYEFWESTDKEGFAPTFTRLFGRDYRGYTEEFDKWLLQPNEDLYAVLDDIFANKVSARGEADPNRRVRPERKAIP